MPRKAKFSKEEIIKTAVNIIENKGFQFLTARSIGKELNTSARPIFTTFNNMEDVLHGVNIYANDLYQNYISEGLKEEIAFKGVGTAYIRFASEHPKLFQLLFMKELNQISTSSNILNIIESSYQKILESIINLYNISMDFAKELYLHMWIYTHGIAVLIVNKMCNFNDEEISNMLSTICKSLMLNGGKK